MIIAVSVSKEIGFRGGVELTSNVYHYDTGITAASWDTIADAVVTSDKNAHSSLVAYKSVRVWGPTDGGAGASETRLIKDITGSGNLTATGGSIYSELAIVVNWYLGRATGTGRKRFLRKYLHVMKLPATTGAITGISALAAGDKSPFVTWGNAAKTLNIGPDTMDLCTAQGGHLPVGTNATVLDYLHVRQLKQ